MLPNVVPELRIGPLPFSFRLLRVNVDDQYITNYAEDTKNRDYNSSYQQLMSHEPILKKNFYRDHELHKCS